MTLLKNNITLLFLVLSGLAFAQPPDQQMAAHYYNNGEYDKARLYYEKLYGQSPTDYNYSFYLKTLMALEDYKESEKLVKKHRKRNPRRVTYALDLASVYEATGEQERADDIYQDALKDMPLDYRSVLELGDAFKDKGKLDLALAAFEKGKKHVTSYPFGLKTAEIHGKLGHQEQMISEYLDVLGKQSRYMITVQNAMTRLLDFEEPNASTDLLRTSLLKRVQKDPDNQVYTEMLIWYFIQIRDFNAAIIQGKALDRRMKNSDGEDVMILSNMCRANHEYDVAIKGYKYVVETYPNGFHSSQARLNMMGCLYDKITTSTYTEQDLLDLEAKFEELLSPEQMGRNSITVPIMLQLAHIEAFYLHNRTKAVNILEEAISIPRISQTNLGQCKIELGDVHVMSGNVWDASLYYMQVEKTFKEDVLGHEAKFKNAKIYYYTGQFDWAQAQLNVLKASTSKLISNDAMELSLLITDNLGLDTTARPMQLFANADLLIFQNRFAEALATLDTITREYGAHALSDEILFKKYEIAHKKRDFETAVGYLSAIVTGHGDDILGDDATYLLAEIYDYQMKDKEKAKEHYKKILFDYDNSIYVAEARKRYRALGGNENEGGFTPIIINKEDVEP